MDIEWNPNPLRSKIILNDHDKEILKLKIRIAEMEQWTELLAIYVPEGKFHDLKRAQEIAPQLEEENIDRRVEVLYAYYLNELDVSHVGDCTCVAASCSRCSLERLLGINTIEGLRKHEAYKIQSFFPRDGEQPSIDEVIEKLENYVPAATWEGWEAHAPRWKAEATRAAVWMKAYRDKHFRPLMGDPL